MLVYLRIQGFDLRDELVDGQSIASHRISVRILQFLRVYVRETTLVFCARSKSACSWIES